MTQREVLALCVGLLLVVLGWAVNTGDERAPDGAVEAEGAVVSAAGRAGEAPLDGGAAVGVENAPRIEALPQVEGAAEAPPSTPSARSEPSLEPHAWPAGGLYVRVTKADGALAVGAPIGVWVDGGRSPLASLECDAEGRAHFVDVPALAARYEVGLAAPGGQRSGWPSEVGGEVGGEVGLARATPLELALPRCGSLEVHVVRASRAGTLVELGEGTAAGFRGTVVRAAELDGVARFDWLPLGLELTLRVAFDGGAVEVVVAGPVEPPALGAAPTSPKAERRRVRVGPEGLLEG